jgi:solute carrier family 35 protein E3
MCNAGMFPRATSITKFDRWLIGSIGIVAVIFQNLNLMYNSVGFYQLSKLCNIPFMIVYNYLVDGVKTPPKILFSLVFLLIGIGMFTVNDVSVNWFGTLMACIAIPAGSLTQLFTKSMQTKYSITGPTLQHASALPSFFCCFAVSCFVETHSANNIFTNSWSMLVVGLILLSGLLAIGTNTCAFGLIGKTSAITFQVVGHLKTMLIFAFGLIMFKDPTETKEILMKKVSGLAVAMIGVILYTYFNLTDKQEQRPTPLPEKDEDDQLINNDEQFGVDENSQLDDEEEE